MKNHKNNCIHKVMFIMINHDTINLWRRLVCDFEPCVNIPNPLSIVQPIPNAMIRGSSNMCTLVIWCIDELVSRGAYHSTITIRYHTYFPCSTILFLNAWFMCANQARQVATEFCGLQFIFELSFIHAWIAEHSKLILVFSSGFQSFLFQFPFHYHIGWHVNV